MSLRSLLGGIVADAPPVPYTSRWHTTLAGLGIGQRRDQTSQLSMYGEIGTLHGVVSKLANTTSLVNWRLYKSAPNGEDEDRTEVTRHAAKMVWDSPVKRFFPRQEFVETFQQHLDLTGLAYWVMVTSRLTGGTPVEIWPVRPDRMSPVKSNTEFVSGYVYTSPDGEQVPLGRDQVIMLRCPSPLDIYGGMSPIPSLSADLASESAQGAWNAAFFANSAQPGGVIEVDRRMQDDEWEELVTRWNAQHRGVSNAGRVAVLEQAKYVQYNYTQKDMQFVESRGLTKQAILDAYGFPKFGLGDVDDVNRASAQASIALIAQTLTVPRLERIKGALNNEFLPLFGATTAGLEFDYDNPVPPDTETENDTLTAKTAALATLTSAGFDADEACDVVGLPRMKYEKPEPTIVAPPPGRGGERDDERVPA